MATSNWGFKPDLDPDFLEFHVKLTNDLSDLVWKRVGIWKRNISVLEWDLQPDVSVAFDLQYSQTEVFGSILTRNKALLPNLKAALELEGVEILQGGKTPETRTDRFRIIESDVEGMSPSAHAEHIQRIVRKVRQNLIAAFKQSESWRDETTGLKINYTVKNPRKQCRKTIFLFTSIRNRKHWVDFDGANGSTLSSNRARIVFVEDDFAEEYTYFLALRGSNSAYQATVSFIKNYVEENGILWNDVILAGMSKGGTAALALAANLPASVKVVASCPQLDLGRYLSKQRPKVLDQLVGESSNKPDAEANSLLWDLLDKLPNGTESEKRQITLLTSKNDPDCISMLKQFKELFDSQQLTVYYDESDNTSNHVTSVWHLTPLFVSLLGEASSDSQKIHS